MILEDSLSYEDAPVHLRCPVPRCDHSEEAHVKQSRHPTTTAHAYYCCPYKIVIIKFSS
jgi:hypothetical protein